MSEEKILGKIESIHFGNHSDYPWFGLVITFSGPGWGVTSGIKYYINLDKDHKDDALELLYFIKGLLANAKVHDIYDLIGKPVEVELDHNAFKDFRILEEVL